MPYMTYSCNRVIYPPQKEDEIKCRKLCYLNVSQMVRIMPYENIYLLEKWKLYFSMGMTFTCRNLLKLNTCNTDKIGISILFIESFLATHGHV